MIVSFDHKDHFKFSVEDSVALNTPDGCYHLDGKIFMNPHIYNMAIVLHEFNVPLDHPAFSALAELTLFPQWMVDPLRFDYAYFDVFWLKQDLSHVFLKKIKGRAEVLEAVEKLLCEDYDPKLARVYFNYLL